MALPIVENGVDDTVVVGEPILQLRLGPIRKPIYGPWIRLMNQQGYPAGDLDAPQPNDRFFVFGYDWRRSNVDAARQLGQALEALAARRRRPLRVALLAQSNGAVIARYLAKYGTSRLEQAGQGQITPLRDVSIVGVALIGSANGGALRVLEDMHRGRLYMPIVGRRWQPEVLFTYPSLYEALPAPAEDTFVSADGSPLDLDLYDAAAWQRYRWSIFSRRASRRADRAPERFGGDVERLAYAQQQLDRARLLHRLLLDDPVGFEPPPMLSLQNESLPTDRRAVLLPRDNGVPSIRFGGGGLRRGIRTKTLMLEPGDGHATRSSQDALSSAETRALIEPVQYVRGTHFTVVLAEEVQRRCLEFLKRLETHADGPATTR